MKSLLAIAVASMSATGIHAAYLVPNYGTAVPVTSQTVHLNTPVPTSSSVVPAANVAPRFNTIAPTVTPAYSGGVDGPRFNEPPVTSSCVAGQQYYAVLFEQSVFDGVAHWLDASSGECRGLNGTNIGSVRVVSELGGHPVYKRTSNAYADGVTLTYYSDFECAGTTMGTTVGHQPVVESVHGARSVRVECNGRGIGAAAPVPMSAPAAVIMYEDVNYTGTPHQQDGSEGECRGLNGTEVASMHFLPNANSTQPLSDAQSLSHAVIFYDGFGCTGKRIGAITGNLPNVRETILSSNGTFKPLSLKFVSPDLAAFIKQNVQLLSSAESVIASGVALVVPVLAMLFM